MKKIYLDYAATSPVDQRVVEAIEPYFSDSFGNQGSIHSFGQEALAAVDRSRETMAGLLGLSLEESFREIIFTGSATEANNLALRGAVKAFYRLNRDERLLPPRIIVSAIEHESILETGRDLEEEGVELIVIPVDKSGRVRLEEIKKSLNERAILVSVMLSNNEIGRVEPIKKIAEIIEEYKRREQRSKGRALGAKRGYPLLHTDAVQAFQYLDCYPEKMGVDLMTVSGHKIYGPKGVGALYRRRLSSAEREADIILPILTGGGQEFGLRSGTENVSSIVGLAKAAELAVQTRVKERKRLYALRSLFWQKLKKALPKIKLNAETEAGVKSAGLGQPKFLPNILNIRFPGELAGEMIVKFDLAGLAVSSGSACSARLFKPSHVLKAIGLGDKSARESLRFSFGKQTSLSDIREAAERIAKIIRR
jgi:cysteine desulfurase